MTFQNFIFSKDLQVRFLRHFTFWFSYYVFSVLVYFHDFLEKVGMANWIFLELTEVALHVLTQMFFTYVLLYLLIPMYQRTRKWAIVLLLFFGLLIATYGIYLVEHLTWFKAIHRIAGLPRFRPPKVVLWFTLISLFTYFPVSASLAVAIKILKNWYSKHLENQVLLEEKANAELQLLKAQVHPHFLFNTLNNIYSFTLNKSSETPIIVKRLTDTLRYMVDDCNARLVPLQKELDMIQDYMKLEKIRYGKRLEMSMEVEGNTAGKLITPLLMIPFVENSFKHGSSQMLQNPWIKLRIDVKEKELHFQLRNSKPFRTANIRRGGIGLSNVKKRLQLLYPAKHALRIEESDEEFGINMQVPLEAEQVNVTVDL